MTHFLRDILRQPEELQRAIDYLCGAGRITLEEAAAAVRKADHVYLTGIGASWHSALSAGGMLHLGGRPVYLRDAAELLHFAKLPRNAAVVLISRTGGSIEVVQLLAKARECGATVIGLTNSPDGELAREAQIPIVIPVKLDHAISITTYSTLAAAGGSLASATLGAFNSALVAALARAIEETGRCFRHWQEQLANSSWLAPAATYYFLARGPSLGSCYEARLLWEEGVKSPATAMGTGAFRHGPQEVVASGTRFGVWIGARMMRDQDLAVARDLGRLGASVMLIGQELPEDTADLVMQLPPVPLEWQFLIDIIPAQFAAERLANLSGVDCDSFRYCSFIVENESGLFDEKLAAPRDEG